MNMNRMLATVLACAFLAGCADLKEDLREIRDLVRALRGREPAPPPPAPPPAAQIPAPAAAGLNLLGNCVAREETGYAENVRLDVARGEVRQLDARIDIPKRGSCRFQLSEFRQTSQAPYVELMARSGTACAVRIWQQGDRITVAATDCAEKCTRGASDYLWPIQLNTAGGCY
jgi:hypothetical protein